MAPDCRSYIGKRSSAFLAHKRGPDCSSRTRTSEFFLRIIRADTVRRSINDHDVLGPESLFRDGIEDETVTASRVGHDVEAIAPRTVIEDGRDEPVSRELAREHAPEIAVRATALKNGPSIDEDITKSRLGLLKCEPEVPEPPYVVSHDDLADVGTRAREAGGAESRLRGKGKSKVTALVHREKSRGRQVQKAHAPAR